MQKTIAQLVQETKEDAKSFVLAKKDLLKLQALEKGIPAAVLTVYFAIITVLLCLCVAFALLCAAFALSIPFAQEWSRIPLSLTIGFGIMAGIFLILALVFLALKTVVCRSISSKLMESQLEKMDNEENVRSIRQQIQKAESRLAEDKLESSQREQNTERDIEPIVYEQF